MNELPPGASVYVHGGLYYGKEGTVVRLAGKQSVRVDIINERKGLTKEVTVRRHNVQRINVDKTDENRDSVTGSALAATELTRVAAEITRVSTELTVLAEQLLDLEKAMKRLVVVGEGRGDGGQRK